jgi:hypothetical protein
MALLSVFLITVARRRTTTDLSLLVFLRTMSKYRKAGVHTKHDLDDQREKKHFYTMLQTPFSETTIDEEIVPMFIYQRHKYLKHAQGTHLDTQNRTRRSRRHGIQYRAL